MNRVFILALKIDWFRITKEKNIRESKFFSKINLWNGLVLERKEM